MEGGGGERVQRGGCRGVREQKGVGGGVLLQRQKALAPVVGQSVMAGGLVLIWKDRRLKRGLVQRVDGD